MLDRPSVWYHYLGIHEPDFFTKILENTVHEIYEGAGNGLDTYFCHQIFHCTFRRNMFPFGIRKTKLDPQRFLGIYDSHNFNTLFVIQLPAAQFAKNFV